MFFASIRRFASWTLLILCALAAAWLFLWNLGSLPLYIWDEPMYAGVEWHIVYTHDWFHLIDWTQPYFDKPALPLWLGALSMIAFGFTEFAARLPSALEGIATIVLLCLWARRQTGSIWAMPVVTVLFAASQFYFFHSFRSADTDSLLSLLMTASLFTYERSKESSRWMIACGILLGLLGMTKSVEMFVPMIVMGADAFLTGSWKRIRARHVMIGLLLSIAIVLPWHIAMLIAYGSWFWNVYVVELIFHRWDTTLNSPHIGWGYFFGIFQENLFPVWLIIIPALLWQIRALLRDRVRDARLLWTLWVLIGVWVITTAVSRQPWYTIPFCLPLLLLTTDAVVAWWRDTSADWLRSAAVVWIALCALVLRPCLSGICRPVAAFSHNDPLSIAVILVVLAITVHLFIARRMPAFSPWLQRCFLVVTLLILLLPALRANIDTINAFPRQPGGARDMASFLMKQSGTGKTLIVPSQLSDAQYRLGELYWLRAEPALNVIVAPSDAQYQREIAKQHTYILYSPATVGTPIPSGYSPVYVFDDLELLGKKQ